MTGRESSDGSLALTYSAVKKVSTSFEATAYLYLYRHDQRRESLSSLYCEAALADVVMT